MERLIVIVCSSALVSSAAHFIDAGVDLAVDVGVDVEVDDVVLS
jgi:chloramphenicol 3-O-phosphotransferase